MTERETKELSTLQARVAFAKTGSTFPASLELIEQSQSNIPLPSAVAEKDDTQVKVTTAKEFYSDVDQTLQRWEKTSPTSDGIADFSNKIKNYLDNGTEIGPKEREELKIMQVRAAWATPGDTFESSFAAIKESRVKASWADVDVKIPPSAK